MHIAQTYTYIFITGVNRAPFGAMQMQYYANWFCICNVHCAGLNNAFQASGIMLFISYFFHLPIDFNGIFVSTLININYTNQIIT